VNRARTDAPHNVRLESADIDTLRAIPTDIDVRKIKDGDPSGQHLRTARANLLEEVAPKLAAESDCPPSIIVDSGGGLHCGDNSILRFQRPRRTLKQCRASGGQ
jgi:hypothetical protein